MNKVFNSIGIYNKNSQILRLDFEIYNNRYFIAGFLKRLNIYKKF